MENLKFLCNCTDPYKECFCEGRPNVSAFLGAYDCNQQIIKEK